MFPATIIKALTIENNIIRYFSLFFVNAKFDNYYVIKNHQLVMGISQKGNHIAGADDTRMVQNRKRDES